MAKTLGPSLKTLFPRVSQAPLECSHFVITTAKWANTSKSRPRTFLQIQVQLLHYSAKLSFASNGPRKMGSQMTPVVVLTLPASWAAGSQVLVILGTDNKHHPFCLLFKKDRRCYEGAHQFRIQLDFPSSWNKTLPLSLHGHCWWRPLSLWHLQVSEEPLAQGRHIGWQDHFCSLSKLSSLMLCWLVRAEDTVLLGLLFI